jgi:hypothetical protein
MSKKVAKNEDVSMEPARDRRLWREDAIGWLQNQAAALPEEPKSRWHVTRPSAEAQQNAELILRKTPPHLIPTELTVTLDQGIELDWRNGQKGLEIEILSDGSLEVLRCLDGEPVKESKLPGPEWSKLDEAFGWLGNP